MLDDELVPLGHINGVFGVRGWLKVFSDTQPRENIVGYKTWLVSPPATTRSAGASKDWSEIKLIDGKRHGKNVVVRLEGVDDREQAAALVGYQVAVRRNQMAELAEGEYYWSDLIGHRVTNTEGLELGVVKRLFETGANDVLVVEAEVGADGERREILIPWVQEHFVINVDHASQQIIVDWQEDY